MMFGFNFSRSKFFAWGKIFEVFQYNRVHIVTCDKKKSTKILMWWLVPGWWKPTKRRARRCLPRKNNPNVSNALLKVKPNILSLRLVLKDSDALFRKSWKLENTLQYFRVIIVAVLLVDRVSCIKNTHWRQQCTSLILYSVIFLLFWFLKFKLSPSEKNAKSQIKAADFNRWKTVVLHTLKKMSFYFWETMKLRQECL